MSSDGQDQLEGDSDQRMSASPENKTSERSSGRTRTMMSPAQLAGLQALWAQAVGNEPINRFPSTLQREQLAAKIGLTPRKVQIWFQNQRQKYRRLEVQQEQQQAALSSGPMASTSSAPYPSEPPSAFPSYGQASSSTPLSHDQTHRRPSYPHHPLLVSAPPAVHGSHSGYAVGSSVGQPSSSWSPPNPASHAYSAYEPQDRLRYSHISPPTVIDLKTASAATKQPTGHDQTASEGLVEKPLPVTGWFDVAAEQRRMSESGPDGPDSVPLVHRNASVPVLPPPSITSAVAVPRLTGHPSFQDMPRFPSSFERGHSVRPGTSGSGRSASPEAHRHSFSSSGESTLSRPSLSDKGSSQTSTAGLPSFRDFLLATSTDAQDAVPASQPLSSSLRHRCGRSSYSSSSASTSASSHGHSSHSHSHSLSTSYPVSRSRHSSTRGIGTSSETPTRPYTGSSTSSSSHARSPTHSSGYTFPATHQGGNRGLPLPPPSVFAYSPSSPVTSPTRERTRPPSESVSMGATYRPDTASSAVSSASVLSHPTHPALAALPLSREGSSISGSYATAPDSSENGVRSGIGAMDLDDDSRPRSAIGVSGRGPLTTMPGMLDVVGFGGEVGLGRFAMGGRR